MNNRSHTPLLSIVGALVTAIAPLISILPTWIIVWCAFFWGYVILSQKFNYPLPSPSIHYTLSIIGGAGVLISHRYIFGGTAFIGLLCVMAGLKPLEIRTHRDRMVTIFLAYFFIITSLLQFENLAMILYLFVSVFIITAVLIQINSPYSGLKDNGILSLKILLNALPLMLALFFLFPRLHSSFIGTFKRPAGRTGYTESLALGDVANLILDDKDAFRVKFKGPIPEPHLLYWRGVVFWDFNGYEWTTSSKIPRQRRHVPGKNPVEYSVVLEPHMKRRIFSLDVPFVSPTETKMLGDLTLILDRRLKKKFRYHLKSYTSYHTGPLQFWEKAALKLPLNKNKKTQKLALEWKQGAGSSEEIIEKGISFFKENDFSYTLKPPQLSNDAIDDFLFRTKKGFCEHYASSFAFLMRAAGVPARVVGGYMGGKMNPYGKYLIISQSDAHAWTEVWLKNRGWVRIDPTAVVSPERITHGVTGAVSEYELPEFLRPKQFGTVLSFWESMRLRWDIVSTQWDIVFIGYSYLQQKKFFSCFKGLPSFSGVLQKIILILLCVLTPVFAFFLWRRKFSCHHSKDTVQQYYEKFSTRLAGIGLPRRPSQGPLDYARMVADAQNSLTHPVNEITRLYIGLRYKKSGNKDTLKRFISQIHKFRPKRMI